MFFVVYYAIIKIIIENKVAGENLMIIAKQIEVMTNIKKYFDLAFKGDTVVVPIQEHENVVIISESKYKEFEKLKNNVEYLKMLDMSIKEAENGNFKVTSLEELEEYE